MWSNRLQLGCHELFKGLLAALDLNYPINGCLTLYLIIRSFWSEKMELGSDAKNFNVIFSLLFTQTQDMNFACQFILYVYISDKIIFMYLIIIFHIWITVRPCKCFIFIWKWFGNHLEVNFETFGGDLEVIRNLLGNYTEVLRLYLAVWYLEFIRKHSE